MTLLKKAFRDGHGTSGMTHENEEIPLQFTHPEKRSRINSDDKGFDCFKMNAIRFIDLDPEPK